MSKVQRYTIDAVFEQTDSEGEWVKYADVTKLEAELAEAVRIAVGLIERECAKVHDYCNCYTQLIGKACFQEEIDKLEKLTGKSWEEIIR